MRDRVRQLAGAAVLAALAALGPRGAQAVALTAQEIAATCAEADGMAHCGRLIEQVQLKRLPGLAVRSGDTLDVTLYPSGRTSFQDPPNGERTYSLWDYLDPINAAVIYVTHGEAASFVLLQRASGRTFEFPAEPKLSPDRQRLATADFCAQSCRNEVAIWRIDRQGVRKEASWSPSERWTDASAAWKSADAIAIEFATAGAAATHSIERRLTDPGWTRLVNP